MLFDFDFVSDEMMQLPRLQGVAHGGALCSPPGHGLRLSVRHDASDKLAAFTEAFSHVHIQKPSLQILSLFHSDSLSFSGSHSFSFTFKKLFIQIHKNLCHIQTY